MNFRAFREFQDGEIIGGMGYDIVVHRRTIGELVLPSGQLVACDPLLALDTEPYDIELEPGSYPTHLVIPEMRDEKMVAYAVITVDASDVQRWEVAPLPPPPLASPLGHRDEDGFAVDSGLGAFLDRDTASAIINYHQLMMPEDNDFERHLWGRINRRRRRGVGWATIDLRRDLKLPFGDGRNLLAFDTGFGNGYYTTYLGRNSDDEIARIVTDFEVLDFRFPSFPMRRS